MAYRRGARRPSKSEVLLFRTTSIGKVLIATILGLAFAFAGVFILMIATWIDSGFGIAIALFMGLMFLVIGSFAAISSVVEMFSPVRVYIEDNQLIIHKKRVFGLPKMTFVAIGDIRGAIVDTKLDTDTEEKRPTESYRVALVLANDERQPLADYHYLSNMNEARQLAGRVEEMLKDAHTEGG